MNKPPKPPKTQKTPKAANDLEVFDAETKRSQRRVAKAPDKITKALDDPEMRAQIVAAMRRMFDEGQA